MKKIYIFLIIIVIIIVYAFSKYSEYKNKYSEIKNFNSQYEKFLNRDISGTDLTSVINKAVDDNQRNLIDKDENGRYKKNDINSISIDVKVTDLKEDTIIPMENIYNGGMNKFVSLYNTINFKCTKVEYNSTKKISYMLFEQITN